MATDPVTTEILRKKFRNNFDLCNFAIVIGRNAIMSNPQATLQNILDEVDARASEGQVRVEDEPR